MQTSIISREVIQGPWFLSVPLLLTDFWLGEVPPECANAFFLDKDDAGVILIRT